MDVPAAAAAAPAIPPEPAPTPAPPATAAAPVTASGPAPAVRAQTNAAGQTPSNQPSDTTLAPLVAKLFNAAENNVAVSFQVLHDPDEVVTVFTDKSTGKEIIQFPSQALIALAEMYDKEAGKVLDKSV